MNFMITTSLNSVRNNTNVKIQMIVRQIVLSLSDFWSFEKAEELTKKYGLDSQFALNYGGRAWNYAGSYGLAKMF